MKDLISERWVELNSKMTYTRFPSLMISVFNLTYASFWYKMNSKSIRTFFATVRRKI